MTVTSTNYMPVKIVINKHQDEILGTDRLYISALPIK